MEIGKIIYLCIMLAIIFFLIGYGVGYCIWEKKCDHKFEEVLKTTSHGNSVVVHMCKKCGKRKITKV